MCLSTAVIIHLHMLTRCARCTIALNLLWEVMCSRHRRQQRYNATCTIQLGDGCVSAIILEPLQREYALTNEGFQSCCTVIARNENLYYKIEWLANKSFIFFVGGCNKFTVAAKLDDPHIKLYVSEIVFVKNDT